ncbi:putative metalloprotease CJM1_0395 family protein [Shewanella atlantica]|uniref:Catalase n=1 Tax=Shewanella atlantica TaxID=271099 RepID=A0A3S0IGX6_9GAMM|nr:putative metalloprotease CJM1_0395 family protein [Shewanella atlantica]RTR33716.1 hypothetical protein EKG39_08450 [Shewanella atlantica]
MLGVISSPDIQRRQEHKLPAVPAASRAGLKSAPAIDSSAKPAVSSESINGKIRQTQPSKSSSTRPVSESIAVSPNVFAPVTNSAVLTAETTHISSPQIATSDLSVNRLNVNENPPQPTFSLTLGPLTVAGIFNARSSATGFEVSDSTFNPQVPQGPEVSSVFDEIFSPTTINPGEGRDAVEPGTSGNRSVEPDSPPQNIFAKESDAGDEKEPVSIFKPSELSEQGGKDESDNVKAVIEQQILAELAKRDSEVKAHEHAHSSVGGSLAQSPQFSYERGSDGNRYAVDGEVSIDISIVQGDPLATINKMRKVYAAAMAPANPSMADIRVAADALRKINQAQSELVEKRQSEVMTIEDMTPLIDAQAFLDGLNPPEPPEIAIGGEIDTTGTIRRAQPEENNVVKQTIERINEQVKAPSEPVFELLSSKDQTEGYLTKTLLEKYLPVNSASGSLSFSV